MKFDDLYNRVFVNEQDQPSDMSTEVAHPDDVSVDPIPLPSPGDVQSGAASAPMTSSSLTDYITQCNDFADKLQSASGDCLQSLVAGLDKPLTPFDGISSTKSDIENAAGLLRRLAGKMLSYTIAATKK